MAKIQIYLEKILSAVYGKDVRGSIHDSIKAMNDEVEENKEAEKSRIVNEERRTSSENIRIVSEEIRESEENKREENETKRIAEENKRVSEENKRIMSDALRYSEELERDKKEKERISNENKRINAENQRIEIEKTRVTSEESRKNAEIQRKSDYDKRITEENNRKQNEEKRVNNEENRKNNEIKRQESFSNLSKMADEKLKKIDDVISGKSVTDKSLTIEGQAADAKETGRRFDETKKDIAKISSLKSNIDKIEFGIGKVVEVKGFKEGWQATSDGILTIFISCQEENKQTTYLLLKTVNGKSGDDAMHSAYGIKRTGILFDIGVVPINKGEKYITEYLENIEEVSYFFYPFETRVKGGN